VGLSREELDLTRYSLGDYGAKALGACFVSAAGKDTY
jgi:hypothetical protein